MITFYFKEDKLFNNINDAKEFAQRFTDKRIETYYSDNDFKTVLNKYIQARENNEDILTSLDYAVRK